MSFLSVPLPTASQVAFLFLFVTLVSTGNLLQCAKRNTRDIIIDMNLDVLCIRDATFACESQREFYSSREN